MVLFCSREQVRRAWRALELKIKMLIRLCLMREGLVLLYRNFLFKLILFLLNSTASSDQLHPTICGYVSFPVATYGSGPSHVWNASTETAYAVRVHGSYRTNPSPNVHEQHPYATPAIQSTIQTTTVANRTSTLHAAIQPQWWPCNFASGGCASRKLRLPTSDGERPHAWAVLTSTAIEPGGYELHLTTSTQSTTATCGAT